MQAPIPHFYLLREHIRVPPAVCLKAATEALLLLHVHFVKLTDRYGISRTRNAGRESARRTWQKAVARALRWVHVSCVRTKRYVWLAGPDPINGNA